MVDIRDDLKLIAEMVEPNSRVLDVGCGDGALLDHLAHTKNVDGRGIELSMDGVRQCVAHGLSVIQGDAETDLKDYPAEAFDYVILGQTLQAMKQPRDVLEMLCRIGRRAIVSVPNFGYWRVRMQLLLTGRMPVTEKLGYQWWETPNIHFCTLRDFVVLTEEMGITIEQTRIIDRAGRVTHPSSRRCRDRGALGDAGGLAAQIAQVVQLGATDGALADQLDRVDARGVQREHALHALAVADLANGEGAVHTGVLAGDHDALIGLDTLARAFDDLHVHADGIARGELRDRLATEGLLDLLLLELLQQVHSTTPFLSARLAADRHSGFGSRRRACRRPLFVTFSAGRLAW